MFLTRIGFGSRAVVTGDVTQTDLPRGKESGLRHVSRVLRRRRRHRVHPLHRRGRRAPSARAEDRRPPTRATKSNATDGNRMGTRRSRSRFRTSRAPRGSRRKHRLRSWVLAAVSGPTEGAGRRPPPRAKSSIRIVGTHESADLNSRYRGKRGPTNVLAFLSDLPRRDAESGEAIATKRRAWTESERRRERTPAIPGRAESEGRCIARRDGNTARQGVPPARPLRRRAEAAPRVDAAAAGRARRRLRRLRRRRGRLRHAASRRPRDLRAGALARGARATQVVRRPLGAHRGARGLHLLGFDHETEEQADDGGSRAQDPCSAWVSRIPTRSAANELLRKRGAFKIIPSHGRRNPS